MKLFTNLFAAALLCCVTVGCNTAEGVKEDAKAAGAAVGDAAKDGAKAVGDGVEAVKEGAKDVKDAVTGDAKEGE
jgi:predicted small secreted protein